MNIYELMVDIYGVDVQLDMVIEECAELQKAILKYRRLQKKYKKDISLVNNLMQEHLSKNNIIEEWADVTIMLNQLKYIISGDYELMYNDKIKHVKHLLRIHHSLYEGKDYESL